MVVVVAVAVVAVDLIVVVAAAGFVHHAPLVRCSNLDCSKTKRTPIPIDSSPESSRRNVFKADLFGTGTIPTVEISSMEKIGPGKKSAQGYVVETVVAHGCYRGRCRCLYCCRYCNK